MPDCLFCAIAGGEVPADKVRETERTVAFTDINPQAPVHVLVIPRTKCPERARDSRYGRAEGERCAAGSQ